MSEAIKALIAAAERFIAAYRSPQATHTDAVDCICALEVAIAAAKAAAEARPEPDPRGVTKLREPLPGRAEIAIRVGANTMSGSCLIADIAKDVAELAGVMMRRHGEARPEPAPDSAARDWPEDFADENGNYSVLCSICQQWFLGYKRRVACKVCATKEARPDPKPVRHCAKCGKPENAHDARHPFVGTGEPIRPEPAAEPSEVAKLIHQGHEFLNASAVLPAVRAALRALEALVREVRE